MKDLSRIATAELTRFLANNLPKLCANWWQKHVVDRLSFQQQRIVQERGQRTLQELDLAALLRVLDQNWYELSSALQWPRENRTFVKEFQTVRNKWAHLSAQAMPSSEIYRDADTEVCYLSKGQGWLIAWRVVVAVFVILQFRAICFSLDCAKISCPSNDLFKE